MTGERAGEARPGRVQLAELVETSRAVAAATRRSEKIERIAGRLREARPEEIEVVVGLLAGSPRQGRMGVGRAAIRTAAARAGTAAGPLAVAEVDAAFARLAATRGAGSEAERARQLGVLFGRARPAEREFLARLLLGELRQGALEGIVAEAVARAADVPAEDVRRALMLEGDLGRVALVALGEGRAGLARFDVTLFRPLLPMLASPAADVSAALDALGEAALEYKLDGARIQVHKAGADVRVFTRRLNDVTASVPEVVDAVRAAPVRELILDGEALALRPDGRPHAFQTTMRRFGRRLDVEAARERLPLRPFFFDCLRVDGESLLDRSGRERVAALRRSLPGLAIPRIVTARLEEAEAFQREALAAGHEGLVAKSPSAPYRAGARGAEWLKIKPAPTFDLVVLAAEWGSGRRRGWLSNLHLGARDPERGGFAMVGKTFKGMTDEVLRWQTRRLQEIEVSRDAWTVRVRPELVVEIAVSGVQGSPHYPSGLALRFARLRGYRPDKCPAEADPVDRLRALCDVDGRAGPA